MKSSLALLAVLMTWMLYANVHGRSIVFDRKEATLSAYTTFETDVQQNCPCSDPKLCLPVRMAHPHQANVTKHEVYAFSITQDDRWKHYDYDLVTTIAWNTDKQLLCHAHAKGVKIAVKHNFDETSKLCDIEARRAWIQDTYRMIVENYADGVNIDNEQPMQGEIAKCQTMLVNELRTELQRHPLTKGAQISFDVSWAPRGVDGRYYEWKELSLAADFLFVMSYDMRSQLYSHCIAGANSPLALVRQGLEEFLLAYHIAPSKLVLGLPWYGYKYPCKAPIQEVTQLCAIEAVPFVDAPCSDAAGTQVDYGDIQRVATGVAFGVRHWDNVTHSPFLVFRNGSGSGSASASGDVEFWFDNEQSLTLKYALAKELKLLGVGMWNADSLDYEHAASDSAAIWRTLRAGL